MHAQALCNYGNHQAVKDCFCLGTGVPRHRDGVVRPYVRTCVRPYVRTYVFSVYFIRHKAVVARAATEAEHTKVIMVAYEYTYQDHEYIIRTMNTKHERCGMAFLLHTRLQSVVLRHLL